MVDATPRVERVRYESRFSLASVHDVETITPGYRRITLSGEGLSGITSLSPRDHVKVVIPRNAAATPVVPGKREKGQDAREGEPEQTVRTFSLRRVLPDVKQIQIDFVLHDAGPATAWARQARPGQQVGIVGPRGSKIVHPVFEWFLMIGDETMLPSIARQAEEAGTEISQIACVEVSGSGYDAVLRSTDTLRVVWADRGDSAPGIGTALLDAVRRLELPEGEGYVFAGGEAGVLRPIRRHLIDERGFSPENISMSGHWKLGAANHDHHSPIDPEEGR
jgi:NADPH-dependent ferric siderophore reductase